MAVSFKGKKLFPINFFQLWIIWRHKMMNPTQPSLILTFNTNQLSTHGLWLLSAPAKADSRWRSERHRRNFHIYIVQHLHQPNRLPLRMASEVPTSFLVFHPTGEVSKMLGFFHQKKVSVHSRNGAFSIFVDYWSAAFSKIQFNVHYEAWES